MTNSSGDKTKYNLDELYRDETPLRRYRRLTVGGNSTLWDFIWHELVLGICTGLPGIVGIGVRNILYSGLFPKFDRKAYIGKQVTLRCPRQITLCEGTIVDDFVQLIATSQKQEAITLGRNSFLRSYAMLNSGPPDGFIHIGENSSIGQGTILYGNGGLTIGDKVLIAGQCFIVASSHNTEDKNIPYADQGYSARGIVIEDNTWIGAGVKIMDGVTIGSGSVIGANAVVTKSVPANSKMVGVPARPIEPSGAT